MESLSLDHNYPNDRNSKAWPHTSATSVGASEGNADSLICAILAAERLDEISTAEDSIERYLRYQGSVDEQTGRLQSGVIFWVYPTGGKGPYECLEDGTVLKHGLLLTVERGASLREAVKRAELALPVSGIAHEHVGSTK